MREHMNSDDIRRRVDAWVANGWVVAAHRDDILSDLQDGVKQASGASRLAQAVIMLGAVLIAAGLLSFIAANWDDMSRLLRLALLFGGMIGAFILFGWLRATARHAWASEAALLLALAVYGAAIMLVAQMYHIQGHYPDALLIWGLGALLAAWLLESPSALMLAMLGIVGWSAAQAGQFGIQPHWPFLLPWAAALLLATDHRWWHALHVVMAGFFLWLTINLLIAPVLSFNHNEVALGSLLLLLLAPQAAFLLGIRLHTSSRARIGDIGRVLFTQGAVIWPFMVMFSDNIVTQRLVHVAPPAGMALLASAAVAFVMIVVLAWLARANGRLRSGDVALTLLIALATILIALRLLPDTIWPFVISAAATLALAAWLIMLGLREGRRLPMWIGAVTFAIEVIYVYVRLIGGLLHTALFFFIGGLLLVGLAVGMRWLATRREKAS